MPRNDAAAPGHVCPGIRIHAIDIVQPPGIGISPIADMDAHQRVVSGTDRIFQLGIGREFRTALMTAPRVGRLEEGRSHSTAPGADAPTPPHHCGRSLVPTLLCS
jgi:hypothetical protein